MRIPKRKTIGIVLAAGEASRMPNKLLLPIADDLLVIESSLRLLLAVNVNETCVVVPALDHSIVQALRSLRNWSDLAFVKQEFSGVCAAITSGVKYLDDDDKVIVMFGDNVYDVNEVSFLQGAILSKKPLATCRILDYDCAHFDYWDGPKDFTQGRWKNRWDSAICGRCCLCGWLVGSAKDFRVPPSCSGLPELLNSHGFKPLLIPNSSWHDVGTPDGYSRYINSL